MGEQDKGKRFVLRDGKFVEGKASPWLPPEHMRKLPQSFTTRDEAEGEKVHELDPPHIVRALTAEQSKLEAKPALPEAVQQVADALFPSNEVVPLSQERIDIIRFRVLRARITRLAASPDPQKALDETKVDYIYFPENNVNKYELRAKEARPGVSALPHPLPRHLRGFRLELDIYSWPQSMVDALAQLGIVVPDFRRMFDDIRRQASVAEELQRAESSLLQ